MAPDVSAPASAPSVLTRGSASSRSLTLALYAFAVFGWELVVLVAVDPIIVRRLDGAPSALAHWLLTALGWLLGAAIVGRLARRDARGIPRVVGRVEVAGPPESVIPRTAGHHVLLRTVAVVLAVSTCIGVRAAMTGEWKLPHEIADLRERFAEWAPAALAALMIYYAAEVVVVVLLLRLGQRAGEQRFGRPAVPWGGLLLASTWGAVHILLQGPSAGVYAMVASVLYGVILACGPRERATRSTAGSFTVTAGLVGVAFLG